MLVNIERYVLFCCFIRSIIATSVTAGKAPGRLYLNRIRILLEDDKLKLIARLVLLFDEKVF